MIKIDDFLQKNITLCIPSLTETVNREFHLPLSSPSTTKKNIIFQVMIKMDGQWRILHFAFQVPSLTIET